MNNQKDIQLASIEAMSRVIKDGQGFDWIIITASRDWHEFWLARLESLRGEIIGKNTGIILQDEDWPGGAGQLLGTLYAWEKANSELLRLRNIDLAQELKAGKKIAIYHTTGHGKRMAPLSLSEGGEKAAIRLPRFIDVNNKKDFLTILEAVIFSSQIFAPSRGGRLTVFWGDQIVIPARGPELEGEVCAEIFCQKHSLPKNEEEWGKEWQGYGVLILDPKRGVLQREKISWATFLRFNPYESRGRDSDKLEVAKSLGIFSLSFDFLAALLKEFKTELKIKGGNLSIEPHLWMPLTCSEEEYRELGGAPDYYQRIYQLKKSFEKEHATSVVLKEKDLGENGFWWDFGNINSYQNNLLKGTRDNLEGRAFRRFFDLEKFWIKKKQTPLVEIENSILVNSRIGGKIKNSLVLGAKIPNIKVHQSLIFNAKAPKITGGHALIYNLQEPKPLAFKNKDVLTDILLKTGKVRVKTKTFRDGKKDWERKILGNPDSYEKLIGLI